MTEHAMVSQFFSTLKIFTKDGAFRLIFFFFNKKKKLYFSSQILVLDNIHMKICKYIFL